MEYCALVVKARKVAAVGAEECMWQPPSDKWGGRDTPSRRSVKCNSSREARREEGQRRRRLRVRREVRDAVRASHKASAEGLTALEDVIGALVVHECRCMAAYVT